MGHSHERPGFGGRRSVGDHQAGPEVIAQTSCLKSYKMELLQLPVAETSAGEARRETAGSSLLLT